MYDFSIKQGDTQPSFEVQLLNENREPRPLDNAEKVLFHMETASDDTVVIDGGMATVVDADDGRVRYDWQDGDTAEPGRYQAEFEVHYVNDSGVETFPNTGYLSVAVTEDIA